MRTRLVHDRSAPPHRRAWRVAPALLLAACASTTGATFRSGVGDAFPDRPPYYAGAPAASGTERVGHFPVGYQSGATQSPIFEPGAGAGSAVAALVADMNGYLDSLGVTTRIAAGTAGDDALRGTPPDVRFGCYADATDECASGDDGPALRDTPADQPRMHLAVGRPSPEWIAAARGATERAGVGRALVVTLEVGQYVVTKTGWRNSKSLELGTGYSVKLPWLTSLDAPVQVLQLTGVVVEPSGRAARIGAEGLLARRTGLVMSGFGAQRLITDEDVAALRTLRRDDLPGRPLAWQVGLRTLVAGLTGRAELAAR